MTDIRKKIEVLKSSIELSELMIRVWTERLDLNYVKSKIEEVEAIIIEATKELNEIKRYPDDAPREIERLRKSIRYDKKELILLENAKLIEKLKKMKESLENVDAKDNSDQEVSR